MRRGYLLDARSTVPIGTSAQPALFTNVISTPYELARLMVAIHRGAIGRGGVGRVGIGVVATRREIVARLLRVQDRTKFVAGLPAGVAVMHKTGYTEQVKHDAGVVYAARGPIVMAGMTWSQSGVSDAVGDPFLAEVARTAYARLGRGGSCGQG